MDTWICRPEVSPNGRVRIVVDVHGFGHKTGAGLVLGNGVLVCINVYSLVGLGIGV